MNELKTEQVFIKQVGVKDFKHAEKGRPVILGTSGEVRDYPGIDGTPFSIPIAKDWSGIYSEVPTENDFITLQDYNTIPLEELETKYVKANSRRPNIAYKVYKFISKLMSKV